MPRQIQHIMMLDIVVLRAAFRNAGMQAGNLAHVAARRMSAGPFEAPPSGAREAPERRARQRRPREAPERRASGGPPSGVRAALERSATRAATERRPSCASALRSQTPNRLPKLRGLTRCEQPQHLVAEEQLQNFAAHHAALPGRPHADWRTLAQDRAQWCWVSASFTARQMSLLSTTFGAARCTAEAKMKSA